jgi:hypothetical protein
MSAPAAAPSDQARLYYDITADKLKLSVNTGSYYNVATEADMQKLRNLINTGGI